jgi:dihydrolipoamide dehydrogenase
MATLSLRASPENVRIGVFDAIFPPIMTIASGDTDGFVKVIFDAKTGALIGAHMIGAEVTEMIQGYVTAIAMEATEEDIHGIVYPHPTMSEAMHEAALDAYGRVIHI